MLLRWLTGLVFSSIAVSAAEFQKLFDLDAYSSSISWKECGQHDSQPFHCGRLNVPLDYARPERGNASLSVMKLLANPSRRRGSLFTNPGGPGISGTGEYSQMRAAQIMEQTQGEYDIISWDIRGVNDTTPSVKCFDNHEAASSFWSDSLWYSGVETNSSLRSSPDLESFYSHVDTEDTRLRDLWNRCLSMNGDTLSYIGTTANARDLLSLVDAIDGVGTDVNYWGFSYGSVIGQHVISMFPKRVGRVILDGLVDASVWSLTPGTEFFRTLLTDSDATLRGFARECAQAGSESCALASEGSTEQSILAGIKKLLLDNYDPSFEALPSQLSFSSSIKAELFASLQFPSLTWQPMAAYLRSQQDLVKCLKGNPNACGNITTERHEMKDFFNPEIETMHVYWSIACSDGPNNEDDHRSVRSLFDTVVVSRQQSEMFGAMWPQEGGWPCVHWKARATERLTEFRAKPKNPVLLISNMFDPITSISNADKIMQYYDNASVGLGVRAGYGHCSYSMSSPCIDGVVQAYMRDWTLPEKHMAPCPTSDNLFPHCD